MTEHKPHEPDPSRFEEKELEQRLERVFREHEDNPLLEEIEWLAGKYLRLERKLHKITRISDKVQAQVMELNTRLGNLAATDQLTGLLNRRGMYEHLEAEMSRLSRDGAPFGLMVIDIDYFKRINDSHGHALGDWALQTVAQTLQSRCRSYDSCSRWGGEEFLFLLPGSSRDTLAQIAQKLVEAVRGIAAPAEAPGLTLSISVGGYLCQAAEPLQQSIQKADDAMYQAKQEGRDGYALHE
ncbi:MAG: GGDEF domain-containing protein [Gammaproteobacteria bacterium]|nr:GGDEF domain-containing protein [Gammaproteobacteria bacterium]